MTTPAGGGEGQVPAANAEQPGQVPSAPTGQADEQQTGGQVPAESGTGGQVDLKSLPESVQAYIASLRGEAANHRTAAQQAAAKVQEYERANETAEQAAQRERDELQAERDRLLNETRELRVGQALTAAVADAKAINPDTVMALLQPKVELDQDGKPQNLEALIEGLRTSDPYLFRRTDAGAGAGTGTEGAPPSGGGLNDWIRGRATGVAR